MLTHDEHLLVNHVCGSWERSESRATLAVLALMLLQDGPRWAGELQDELCDISGGVFNVDAQTLHRMLRRLSGLNLIDCTRVESRGPGAARKVYEASEVGMAVLHAHLQHTLAYLRSESFIDAYTRLTAAPAPVCVCGAAPSIGQLQ